MSRIAGGEMMACFGTALLKRTGHVCVVAMALSLGACAQGGGLDLGLTSEEPKSVDIATSSTGEMNEAELIKATEYWGKKSAENPRDGKAALAYARNLKAMGRKKRAFSVLQSAYMFNSNNRDFLSEYGRLALAYGQVSTADQLLARADDPVKPDWKTISARGTVRAKQGRYQEAIEFYDRARALAPNQPSIINNLAMAYTLDGQAERGENLLREAREMGGKDPRIKENLAFVRDLQGKPDAVTPTVAKANLRPPVTNASASSMDADAIIRAAMAADHERSARR
ncbi:MAG: tetratricopeptide repeat protein [Hyphomicrobiaceae bacterium]